MMRKLTLKLFINPDALVPVGRYLLAAFRNRFRDDLEFCTIYPPDPDSRTLHYFTQVATMLRSRAAWPEPFEQALLAVEQIANTSQGEAEGGAQASAPLRAAIESWLKRHPTNNEREVEEAIEADRRRIEEDQREDPRIREAELREMEWRKVELGIPSQREANDPEPVMVDPAFRAIHVPSLPTLRFPSIKIDSDSTLGAYFMPHQIAWILGEDELHAQKKTVFALAEKSVRIGWTYADAFKNVRKRLRFPKRDYLFATKDYQSALEYMTQAHAFAELLNFTRAIVAHGEDYIKVNLLDAEGLPTAFTEEVRISYIKFDNQSRIIAFSASPQAMAVYGGDVGLDEFAKHPSAQLLWQTAQGRIMWGHDMAVWSAHEGEDTLFNQFAQQARAGQPPWYLYYRVTIADAIDLGLLEVINRTQGTEFTPEQFIADCQARAGLEEIFQQTYMCNPVPGGAGIVDWSPIEGCRSHDYAIERLHLEPNEVLARFGETSLAIRQFLRKSFPKLFAHSANPPLLASSRKERGRKTKTAFSSSVAHRLGFDVAASGEGDMPAFYIDEAIGAEVWLGALLTVRTEDWHFLKTVLFFFLKNLRRVQAAGDETGLGRQICWEAAKEFSGRFLPVNFAQKKRGLGFALMNQLSAGEKRFPKNEADIATDYFALRKTFTGTKWVFSEGRNTCNPLSHCDIAWAGALATHAHNQRESGIGAAVLHEYGIVDYS